MTLQLGLTSKQKAFRQRVIGGSDATIIMSGDSERILRLWREKRGEIEPEDLSDVLPVQMGSFTEPFNRHWFTKQTGLEVIDGGREALSIDYPFMACTLDGIVSQDAQSLVWEAKHVSAFAKSDEIKARYLPQITHNMIVTGCEKAILSVFYGTLKFEAYWFDLDPIYALQLVEAERAFWDCVVSGEAPVIQHVAAPVEAVRRVDMTGNNAWASSAHDWMENAPAAKKFSAAEKAIKELIEPDVSEAFGHKIVVKRNKAGALSIKAAKE